MSRRIDMTNKRISLDDNLRHTITWEFALIMARAERRLAYARKYNLDNETIQMWERKISNATAVVTAMTDKSGRNIYLRNAREIAISEPERE
jgi:hypothetical protein